MSDSEFLIKVLDCMFFTSFVSERGLPWRVWDIWDELYANILEHLRIEQQNPRLLLEHIQVSFVYICRFNKTIAHYIYFQEIAHQLNTSENPNPQPFVTKIPKPTEGSFARIHQPVFPNIDCTKVQAIINEGIAQKIK